MQNETRSPSFVLSSAFCLSLSLLRPCLFSLWMYSLFVAGMMVDEMVRSELQKFAAWMEALGFAGRFKFKHDCIIRPTTINEARALIITHTVVLYDSFLNGLTINLDVKLLWEYNPDDDTDMLLVNAWLHNKSGFNPDQWHAFFVGRLQVIVGGHTVVALKNLHLKYSVSPRWMLVSAELYILPKREETKRWCRVVGVSNNITRETVLKMTSYDFMVLIRKDLHRPGLPALPAKVKKQITGDLETSTGLTKANFGSHRTLALLPQEHFDLLKRIFTNDPLVYKGFQPPHALSHLIKFGGLPEPVQLDLLKSIITEQWTMAEFMKQCALWKGKARVRDYILEVFNMEDTQDLAEKHPTVAERMKEMITQWGTSVALLPAKAALPGGLVAATKQIYSGALEATNRSNWVADNNPQVGFL